MQKLSCGETLKEISDRRMAAIQAAKDAKTIEQKIAAKARRNERDRNARKSANFYDRQIELAALREARQGNYEREERNERMAKVRQEMAKKGFKRANLASRFTADHRHSAILAVIKGLMDKNKAKYCFPRQDTICWLLWRYYGINVSLRTINIDLQFLDDSGAINRKRRHIRRGGRIALNSTLYLMTKKGHALLKLLSKVFKFLRITRLQNIAQHTSSYTKKKQLCGGKPPVRQAKVPPNGESLMA